MINLFNRFNPPHSFQSLRKRNYIMVGQEFGPYDLTWLKPKPLISHVLTDIDDKSLIAGIKENYKDDEHLYAFSCSMDGSFFCWDSQRKNVDTGEYVICEYDVEARDYASSFKDFLFRVILNYYDDPMDPELYEDSWTKWHEKTLIAIQNIGSSDQISVISDIISRPVEEGVSVFSEGEMEALIVKLTDLGCPE